MWIRKAALAACVLLLARGPALAAEPLTLERALARVIDQHPALGALDLGRAALEAEAQRAAQAPPLTLGAEVENFAGTGARAGVGGAEWTLTLAGVLERGGKRALREALAARRIDAQGSRRAATALSLLTETAQRYLDVAAAQGELALARLEVAERERWASLARQRSAAGAIPESVPLAAEAVAARARFERELADARILLSWRRLAALWGEPDAPLQRANDADVLTLPPAPETGALAQLLARNPELLAFADEARVREASLRIAEASRSADLTWQAGVRRLGDSDDWGLVAGVSVPLNASARSQPARAAARAELDAVSDERAAGERRLLGLVLEAQGVYVASKLTVERLQDDVLPRYEAATAAAERAWQAGALGPLEWSELRDAWLTARRTQFAAAVAARRALIEIQSLTAEPLR